MEHETTSRPLATIRSDLLIALALSAALMAVASQSRAASQAIQSLASIRMQASAFIEAYPYQSPYPARFRLGNLDPRLRLKACREPLRVEFARAELVSGNTALRVGCPVAPAWKIHFPVRIELFDDVLVTATPVVKGQNIDESAVRLRKANVSRLNQGYFKHEIALRDLQVKRNLPANTVLTPANMAPRMMVRAGQRVTLIVEMAGLRIKALGTALRSASLGQPVRVKNTRSQRVVEGIVTGDALVKVGI